MWINGETQNLGVTEALCEFAAKTTYESISPQFIKRLKLFLLDYIGIAAYAARQTESAVPFSKAIELLNGHQHGSSTVVTKGNEYQPHYAALLNGSFAHSLDFDDTYAAGALHPGVTTISAALTEGGTVSGRKFLSALAVGYEITCRIGRALGEGSYARGFHNTSVAGIFGAVATVGHLPGLDPAIIENGFGIAGSKAAGSMQFLENGSWNKRLHPGFAAHDALLALAFAVAGVKGSTKPIEGQNGLLDSYSETSTVAGLLTALGSEWVAETTAIKPYPACRITHGTIDLALQMRTDHHGGSKDGDQARRGVQKLTLTMGPRAFQIVGKPDKNKIHPNNVVDAQFSSYYQLALNWLDGATGWAIYDRLADKDVYDLSERISVQVDPDMKILPTKCSIVWADETVTRGEVVDPIGEPSNPMTREKVEEKFLSLAVPVYGAKKAMRIKNLVMHIEEKGDSKELLELIQ
jgi:2-methylcitrate dehydratase PrpD